MEQKYEKYNAQPKGTKSLFLENILENDDKVKYFKTVKDEIKWESMYHKGSPVPRLVTIQGDTDNDIVPIYRHPVDKHLTLNKWTPCIKLIKERIEQITGQKINHALIQYYRDGNDFIGEHSDKTIDVVPNTYIMNVSLGASREMVLRKKLTDEELNLESKPERQSEKFNMEHNSLFLMSLETNKEWLHSIRQDKRPDNIKSKNELYENGERISITFRTIGTFINLKDNRIFGQGAKNKTLDNYKENTSSELQEGTNMLKAFSKENKETKFDWQENYGEGFDIINLDVVNS